LGVKPETVFQNVFGKDSPEKLRLLGKTLQTLQVGCNGQFAWVTISKKERELNQATIEDTESFIGHLTVLKGVKIAALFREEDNGTTKLSLRGLHNQPVIEIAKKFGGGGHRFAAGAKIPKSIQETVQLVLTEVSSML
ncbi:MAG: DHH family phosphoesterase, partial [Pseudomonadota bacterium]